MYYRYGDLQVSEDITQESFTKLWERCKEVSFDKAKPYLYKTARNLILNRIKHEKVVLDYHVKSGKRHDHDIEDPEFVIRKKEFEIQLKKAIDNLPVKQRESFLLSRVDKKTYNEIAELSGVSVKAIEKRIHGALITLRRQLGDVL